MPLLIDTSEVHALAGEMRAYCDIVPARAGLALSKVLHDMAGTAQGLVAVDTGLLKSTIRAEVSGLDGYVIADTEYADYVEDGTSEQAPQPYMGPAFDQHEPRLEDALGQLGERIL